jgi:sulfur carrier protein ThiS
MQIEIKLLTQFKQYLPDPELTGNTRVIEVEKDAAIADALISLGIPIDMPKVIMLNNRQTTLPTTLKEGDRLTVFPPVGGG